MVPSVVKPSGGHTTSFGQIIEYIQDRIYLASYTHPPNRATPFPYPTSKSPSKRSSKHPTPVAQKSPVYFSVDETLLYNRFHADFGPLHIGHLYRFAVQLHETLGDVDNVNRPVVFWSQTDPRSRANAACILACYMILIQSWPPHLALAPIAQADPPFMPFRDAGYSQADYGLSIQDVVYGVWKAKEEGICSLKDFKLEEYERYERVDMGDFNWITPSFLAFASPQQTPVTPIPTSSPQYALVPKDIAGVEASNLPDPFKNVLAHFSRKNVGLVVRLNSELYCPTYFTALGISHVDMVFDDGTCPPLSTVRKFIRLAHDQIAGNKSVAVHCKAGLGRTGCLIGAYLIYRHGFTANDLIAYMRFMRPGMVVGPQQHWLHLNQGTFREWWWEDSFKQKLVSMMPLTPTRSATRMRGPHGTPSSQQARRAALGELSTNESSNSGVVSTMDECLPAPTPGQPRKTGRGASSSHRGLGGRQSSACFPIATDADVPTSEVVELHTHRRSQAGINESESEEEWAIRKLSRRTSSKSPQGASSEKQRAFSVTTTTTTTRYSAVAEGDDALASVSMSDVENWNVDVPMIQTGQASLSRVKSKSGGKGGLGVVKARVSPAGRRSADSSGRGGTTTGVRKTSGRVGSMGAVGVGRKT